MKDVKCTPFCAESENGMPSFSTIPTGIYRHPLSGPTPTNDVPLIDDAFRKGGYIDIGTVEGTVESISNRCHGVRRLSRPIDETAGTGRPCSGSARSG